MATLPSLESRRRRRRREKRVTLSEAALNNFKIAIWMYRRGLTSFYAAAALSLLCPFGNARNHTATSQFMKIFAL